jgi:hypothetical protein
MVPGDVRINFGSDFRKKKVKNMAIPFFKSGSSFSSRRKSRERNSGLLDLYSRHLGRIADREV